MSLKTLYLSANFPELEKHYNDFIVRSMQEIPGWKFMHFTPDNYFLAHEQQKNVLNSCDLFIAVLGYCYGQVLDDGNKSLVEIEYEWALEAKLDPIILLTSDDFLISAKNREADEFWNKQKSFRTYAQYTSSLHYFFTTTEEFIQKLILIVKNREKEINDKKRDTGIDKIIFSSKTLKSLNFSQPKAYSTLLDQPNNSAIIPVIYAQGDVIFSEENRMKKHSETYNIDNSGQIGSVGHGAKSQDFTYSVSNSELAKDIDLSTLSSELASLHNKLDEEAIKSEHYIDIGMIAAAEAEAKQGNKSKVFKYLSNVGKWALDIASKIGVEVAIAAIKASQNIP